jgi:tight adherence protein B
MKPVLLLLSLTLLLLAVAAQLWWGGAARQRQRQSLAHMEQRLVGPRGSTSAARAPSASTGDPRPNRWDSLLMRAALSPGLPITLALTTPSVPLAMLAAVRIGSLWVAPVILALYAIMLGLWLRSRIEKQQRQLIRQLPDFLDGMVRLSSIGNSLPMAFQASATQVPMPLRGVLDRAMVSVRAGLDLDRALQLAAQPYRIEALELLHVVLGTGMRLGGRADMILQRMSDFMRDLAQARQELTAITSETRMSAWVLGLLPVVVAILMTLTNPTFFKPMFEQPLGHTMLLVALGLETTGALLLYRLAKSL